MSKEPDLQWSLPLMRLGYGGRGLVYLLLAVFSLLAIWHGSQAEGTGDMLKSLETAPWGQAALILIVIGMASYSIWRWVDAIWDLEEYGTEAKGLVARLGMAITGIVHAGIGVAALLVVATAEDGGGSSIAEWTGWVMSFPAGRLIVGAAGALTIGTGFYYLHKAWSGKYRDKLKSNTFTRRANWALKAGVVAQAVIVSVVGGFLFYAALTASEEQAGGLSKVFEWLRSQPFGQTLVVALCLGLLGFALFCAVNAIWRIIPKLDDGSMESLTDWAEAQANKVV